jgi:hypothetical protein
MNDTLEWTEERIDALQPGRELDVLIATHVMKRKAKFVKGEPCAWDGERKPIMWAPDDWFLEDYDPTRDGVPSPAQFYNPKVVFNYSMYDSGMTRVMDFLRHGAAGLDHLVLDYAPASGWSFTIRWTQKALDQDDRQVAAGRDPELARMAVYRAALKAILIP